MKKLLLLSIIAAFTFASCKKESEKKFFEEKTLRKDTLISSNLRPDPNVIEDMNYDVVAGVYAMELGDTMQVIRLQEGGGKVYMVVRGNYYIWSVKTCYHDYFFTKEQIVNGLSFYCGPIMNEKTKINMWMDDKKKEIYFEIYGKKYVYKKI